MIKKIINLQNKHKQIKEDDIFIASYPRSGSTWLRVMLAHMLYPNKNINDLTDIDLLIPDIHNGIPKYKYNKPRILKTHHPFRLRPGSTTNNYNKAIHLIRNPYDVYKSNYLMHKNNNSQSKINFYDYVSISVHGMLKIGSWSEHSLSWHGASRYANILYIKYENLIQDPVKNILIITDFLEISITPLIAEEINRKSNLDNMRKMVKEGTRYFSKKYNFVRNKESREINETNLDNETKEKINNLIEKYNSTALQIFNY